MKKFLLIMALAASAGIVAQTVDFLSKQQRTIQSDRRAGYDTVQIATMARSLVDSAGRIVVNTNAGAFAYGPGFSGSFDFSGNSGTFKTTTGTNELKGATGVTVNGATTPQVTLSAGKTNTGYFKVNGKTSGSLKVTVADSAAQDVTLSLAAQTTGSATITLPDAGGVSAKLSYYSTATLTAGATPAFAPGAAISTYLLTPGEDETIAATTTGAVAGKVYYIRVLTSGTTSRTLTFGSNFKSTGTLASGTVTAKTFVIGFLFDGTNFCEVSRTTAM